MRLSLLLVLMLVIPACDDGKVAGGSTDGAAIYKSACARCHGPEGIPNRGMAARTGVKPLNSERIRTRLSDEQLRKQIRNGSKNRMMPAFQGALSDAQIAAVVAYLRTLAASASQGAKGAQEQP